MPEQNVQVLAKESMGKQLGGQASGLGGRGFCTYRNDGFPIKMFFCDIPRRAVCTSLSVGILEDTGGLENFKDHAL